MEIEVNGKRYRLHFKRRHVYQAHLLENMLEIPKALDGGTEQSLLRMHGLGTKMLLIALQKYHSDEFGADFDGDYSRQMESAEDLLDDYLEQSGTNLVDFVNTLLDALTSRGIA